MIESAWQPQEASATANYETSATVQNRVGARPARYVAGGAVATQRRNPRCAVQLAPGAHGALRLQPGRGRVGIGAAQRLRFPAGPSDLGHRPSDLSAQAH